MSKFVLVSVSDKSNLKSLIDSLSLLKYKFIASGGTAKFIEESNHAIEKISDYTGALEMLDGRVKTLHPAIYGDILARDTETDRLDMNKMEYRYIDLVVCNLYPFEKNTASADIVLSEAIESVDIDMLARNINELFNNDRDSNASQWRIIGGAVSAVCLLLWVMETTPHQTLTAHIGVRSGPHIVISCSMLKSEGCIIFAVFFQIVAMIFGVTAIFSPCWVETLIYNSSFTISLGICNFCRYSINQSISCKYSINQSISCKYLHGTKLSEIIWLDIDFIIWPQILSVITLIFGFTSIYLTHQNRKKIIVSLTDIYYFSVLLSVLPERSYIERFSSVNSMKWSIIVAWVGLFCHTITNFCLSSVHFIQRSGRNFDVDTVIINHISPAKIISAHIIPIICNFNGVNSSARGIPSEKMPISLPVTSVSENSTTDPKKNHFKYILFLLCFLSYQSSY